MAVPLPYLTVQGFKDLAIIPSQYVDDIEVEQPGWTLKQLGYWSAVIDGRLRKRYAVPFDNDSPPVAIAGWLARIVTLEAYLRRGINATDEQVATIKERATDAHAEIKEAANSETGLFELPLRADSPTGQGVSRGGPMAYTEASAYRWTTVQQAAAGLEDSADGR